MKTRQSQPGFPVLDHGCPLNPLLTEMLPDAPCHPPARHVLKPANPRVVHQSCPGKKPREQETGSVGGGSVGAVCFGFFLNDVRFYPLFDGIIRALDTAVNLRVRHTTSDGKIRGLFEGKSTIV
jgi:hypothetical protein